MMTPPTLLLVSSSLFILFLHFFQTCDANCRPSACGTIRNISSPFRLKHDPKRCGDGRLELSCENDVASIYLNSHKFYVQEINYPNSSIRLVDASITNDTCSFPTHSAYQYNFTFPFPQGYPYQSITRRQTPGYPYYEDVAIPINLMSCPNPLKNSPLFTEVTHCATLSSNSSHHPRIFTYIKVGHMRASEVPYACKVDVIVMTSWKFTDLNNISLSEIHHSLLYGFELIIRSSAEFDKFLYFFSWLLWILMVIVGLVCAGVSLPVMSIIGFAAVSLLLNIVVSDVFTIIDSGGEGATYFPMSLIPLLLDFAILIPRLIIFPLALWFLVYKFRRRHLSMYNTIESFLQSDNKLMPVRYSYSDIKKITRGFQDKLGEGGYGSVYKGKLRSGHDVAVKLLRKSGANGQDFINEIATIGRIHHVNIIKLVGYCSEASKCALIFDFMPNGSLEKYLFNVEKMNSLDLDTKFEIAVGIARGIEYLHRGCDVQILHFDIKPHNVLLDNKFIPKISDFGLAKLCSTESNAVTMTAPRGTIGYVAPELITRSLGRVSYKADVYSYGMLLIEMMNLKRCLTENNSSKYFPCWIYDYVNKGKDVEIGKDDDNDDNDSLRKVARKMTIVALWCIQMSPDDRPSMNKVLDMLEGNVERLQLPEYPSQSTQIPINEDEVVTCTTSFVSLLHHDDVLPGVEIIVQE